MTLKLIKSGTLVTASETYKADILVEGEVISEIGADLQRPGAEVINANGQLQVPRLQVEGVVDPLRGDRPEFKDAARAFLDRFPQAAMTLQLPDFVLYRPEIRGGRMVLSFGRALNLSRDHFLDVPKA